MKTFIFRTSFVLFLLSFALVLTAQVTVSGQITANDVPAGLEGASITLMSDDDTYSADSGVNGDFSVQNVIGSLEGTAYNIIVLADGYMTYTAIITVFEQALDLGVITVNEIAWSPRNVVATPSIEDELVDIVWDAPNPGEYGPAETVINWDSSLDSSAVGTSSAFEWVMGQRYTREQLLNMGVVGLYVKSVSFYVRSSLPTYTIEVYRGGASDLSSPGDLVTSQLVTGVSTYTLFEVVLDEPVQILPGQEIWYCVRATRTSGVSSFFGVDTGPAENEFGNLMYYDGVWTSLYNIAPSWNRNWNVRASVGYIYTSERDIVLSPELNNRTRNNADIRDRLPNMPSRELEGYEVFRMLAEDENNPNAWRWMATLPLATTEYTDTTWEALEEENDYKYAILAVYSNEVYSDAALSNLVAAPDFSGGSGTEEDPWLISRPRDLYDMRDFLNQTGIYFSQTQDIDLGVAPYNEGLGWEPIGDYTNQFRGVYNGNGYTINNLFAERYDTYAGLFGLVGSSGRIIDTHLRDVNVSCTSRYSAGLVAYLYTGWVTECSVTGTVNGANSAGLLTGYFQGGYIYRSWSSGTVSGTSEVGGLIGASTSSTSRTYDSYSHASVTSNETSSGGFVGAHTSGYIYSSYSTGLVTGNGGGFSGTGTATANDCFWDMGTSQKNTSSRGTGLTTEQMTHPYGGDAFSNYNFTTIWDHDSTSYFNNGYPFLLWQFELIVTSVQVAGVEQITVNLLEPIVENYTVDVLDQGGRIMPDEVANWDMVDFEGDNQFEGNVTFLDGVLTVGVTATEGVIRITARSVTDPDIIVIHDVVISYPEASEIEVSGAERIEVDTAEALTEQYAYSALDQFEAPFPGAPVIWSIVDEVGSNVVQEKISIDQTGLLTVNDDAVDGYIKVVVTSQTDIEVLGELLVWITIPFTVTDLEVTGVETVYVPLVDVQTDQFTATVLSQYDDPMPEEEVTWSIVDVAGDNVLEEYITIEEGLLTITTDAVVGVINVIATSVTDILVSDVLQVTVLLPEVTSVSIGGSVEINVPNTGEIYRTYTADVLDQIDRVMPGELVTWTVEDFERENVQNEFISIDSETGEMTILSTALEGIVKVIAISVTDNEVSGEYFVNILGEFFFGDGSENNPFLVATHRHLNAVRNYLNQYDIYFLQIADIDLDVPAYQWGFSPIGNSGSSFRSTYDGNGYKISNLYVDAYQYAGLFGYLAYGATIKNVNLVDVDIRGYQYIGGIAGYVRYQSFAGQNNLIENCSVTGQINATGDQIGGLVGYAYQYLTINNSFVNADVISEWGQEIGGLVGRLSYNTTDPCHIYNSYAFGSVKRLDGGAYIGGLVGRRYGGVISNCYAANLINDGVRQSRVGAIIGENGSVAGPPSGCYWDTEATGMLAGWYNGTSQVTTNSRTTEQMTYPYDANTFVGWDFANEWAADTLYETTNGYPMCLWQLIPIIDSVSLSGVAQITVNITEPTDYEYQSQVLDQANRPMPEEEVVWSIEDVTGNNVTGGTVQLSQAGLLTVTTDAVQGSVRITSTSLTEPEIDNDMVVVIDYPIASSITMTFEERIEVDTIDPLTIQYEIVVLDQFEAIFPGAPVIWTLDDIEGDNVAQERITISQDGLLTVNINAGDGYIKIKVSSATDAEVYDEAIEWISLPLLVTSIVLEGESNVYIPLAGVQEEQYTYTVLSQYDDLMEAEEATLTVLDVEGTNVADEFVSIVDGLLTVTTDAVPGVINVVATSDTDNQVVEIMEVNLLAASVTSIVITGDAYINIPAAESVTSDFVAVALDEIEREIPGELVTWSIYDIDRENALGGQVVIDAETGIITLYSTALDGEIVVKATSQTDGTVFGEYSVALVAEFYGGTGTENDPYLIKRPQHLDSVRGYVGSWTSGIYILQVADIDMDVYPFNQGSGFAKIGTSTSNNFRGTFDGGGYEIQNLYIRSGQYTGLFYYLYGTTVKNVHLVNADIEGGQYTGGIAGYARYANVLVENCSVTGRVYGSSTEVGGLIGYAYQYVTIRNCFVDADVSNYYGYTIGGLVGRLSYSTSYPCSIYNSYSRGSVSSQTGTQNSYNMGGLVGLRYGGTISHCYSTALVNEGVAMNRVASIVGDNRSITAPINTYWDESETGQPIGWYYSTSSANARTTEQMTYPYEDENTFVNWDWLGVWRQDSYTPRVNDGYPIFAYQIPPPAVSSIQIAGADDLTIPTEEPIDSQFTATVYDQYNQIMVGQTVSWELIDSDGDNVTLDFVRIDETGLVTVTTDATVGSFFVVAVSTTDIAVSQQYLVTLSDPITELDTPIVTVSIEDGFVTLEWDLIDGAQSYKVYALAHPDLDFAEWGEAIAVVSSETNDYSEETTDVRKFYRVVASTDAYEPPTLSTPIRASRRIERRD